MIKNGRVRRGYVTTNGADYSRGASFRLIISQFIVYIWPFWNSNEFWFDCCLIQVLRLFESQTISLREHNREIPVGFLLNRRVGWRKLWAEKRGVTALLSIFWMRIYNKKKLQRLMNQHIWWASVHLSRKLISFDCNFSYNCFYNFIHRTRKTHQIPSIDAFWSVQAN